jgi:hypothetical protein
MTAAHTRFSSSSHSNLPKDLREKLNQFCKPSDLEIEDEQLSKDGTIKRVYKCFDGQLIESVLMVGASLLLMSCHASAFVQLTLTYFSNSHTKTGASLRAFRVRLVAHRDGKSSAAGLYRRLCLSKANTFCFRHSVFCATGKCYKAGMHRGPRLTKSRLTTSFDQVKWDSPGNSVNRKSLNKLLGFMRSF